MPFSGLLARRYYATVVGGEKSRRKTKTVSNRFPLTPNVVAVTVQIQQFYFTNAPAELQSERLFVEPIAANRTPLISGRGSKFTIKKLKNNSMLEE